jgi:hypothetical protein
MEMETRSVPMAALGTLKLVTARAWRRELAEMAWEETETEEEMEAELEVIAYIHSTMAPSPPTDTDRPAAAPIFGAMPHPAAPDYPMSLACLLASVSVEDVFAKKPLRHMVVFIGLVLLP